jgi:hypothetical protein
MFENTFDVPYYGIGPDGKIKPETILEFFQEAAALHAASVGIRRVQTSEPVASARKGRSTSRKCRKN